MLRLKFGRSKSGIWLRNGMLIFQHAVATFIVGSLYCLTTINYLTYKDLGFKGDQVITVPLNFFLTLTMKYKNQANIFITNTVQSNKNYQK
jgi:hypothetical protein